jgi:2-hydroxychromene-2-carboxylate isomerase
MAVTVYFDLGSPYSYLTVARARAVLGAEPELAPILAGAIFAARGRGSWFATDERDANVADIERRARLCGLPEMAWPPEEPPHTLDAMRAAVWAARRGRLPEFALAAFRVAFAGGRDLRDREALRAAAEAAGLPAAGLDAAVADPSVKAELRERTDAAWALGVRGVPTIAAGGELYFGDDRLEQAAAAARGEAPPPTPSPPS